MRIKHIVIAALLLSIAVMSIPARTEVTIREFRGERAMQTGEFEVEAPWILDWRVTGQYARDMAVDVSLVQALTNAHEGNVLKARSPGNGVRLFGESGRYFFRVDSTLAGWTLTVKQLTPEEAELYTPKEPPALDY